MMSTALNTTLHKERHAIRGAAAYMLIISAAKG